jgi:hypothetical protein
MTRKLIAPKWPGAPLEVQRWMETVTAILTGRLEGGAPVVATGAEVAVVAQQTGAVSTVADSAAATAQAAAEAAAALDVAKADSAALEAVRQSLGIYATDAAVRELLLRIEALETP